MAAVKLICKKYIILKLFPGEFFRVIVVIGIAKTILQYIKLGLSLNLRYFKAAYIGICLENSPVQISFALRTWRKTRVKTVFISFETQWYSPPLHTSSLKCVFLSIFTSFSASFFCRAVFSMPPHKKLAAGKWWIPTKVPHLFCGWTDAASLEGFAPTKALVISQPEKRFNYSTLLTLAVGWAPRNMCCT